MREHPSPWPPLTLDTPVGRLRLYADERGALARIRAEHPARPFTATATGQHPSSLDDAAVELAEYFLGHRRRFTVPVAPALGHFARDAAAIWRKVGEIPYGEPVSAAHCVPAIGAADPRRLALILAANPLAVIVPTHRVVWGRDDNAAGLVRPSLAIATMLREHERQMAAARPARCEPVSRGVR